MAKRKKAARVIAISAAITAAGLISMGLLLFWGIMPFNNPSRERYPVRGVDVSEYQGEIDWEVLASQEIGFAFIKATEGSQYADPRFAYNREHAAKAGLRIGAYHFFSFDSPGRTQAENFISAAGKAEGMLPPVVDVEPYGKYKRDAKPAAEVLPELDDMLHALEEEYGVKPVLYATQAAYDLYLSGRYDAYPLWVRSVYAFPPQAGWTFWKYSDRAVLAGYSGEERFIDMNAFHGTAEEFDCWPLV